MEEGKKSSTMSDVGAWAMNVVSSVGIIMANKHVPLWELLWFSIVANTSIAGMNLSLMLNSVGFYQISKLSMIPVVCVMEWILHSKHYSREVKMAVVVVVCDGVDPS
ncbi:uncharacterized protein A4U43_C05F18160 [Asparagus officinalis]|uniref:Sugar phosphate transporter domain-containing protein n=1 Tax=Asparagus officinalis TaxID=4686 RepID=A0A5P1ETJ4_ASPOF|nr:uncharacterized protein A4U43_C05F18160 [Asparagus officinalis]